MTAVVVGAGLAGLSVAALLARAGRAVTVLERGWRPGGRAVAARRDGFQLDLGAHLVLGGGAHPLRQLRARLGLDLPLAPIPPRQIALVLDGRVIRLPESWAGLVASPLFGPLAGLRLLLLSWQARRARPEAWWALSLGAWLRQQRLDDRLIERLLGLAGLASFAAGTADLSAGHALEQAQALLRGRPAVGQLVGGWGRLVDALVGCLPTPTATLRLGLPAERLLVERGRVVGVQTREGSLPAEAVVCCVPVQQLPRLAPAEGLLADELRPEAAREPISLLGLDLALSRRLSDGPALLYDVAEQVLLFDPTLADPLLAPSGGQLVQALALASPRELSAPPAERERRAAIERVLDRQLAGWRQAAVFQRRPRLSIAIAARHHYGQPRSALLGPRSASTVGLYFAGDGTAGRGELAAVAIDSALAVAELLS